MSLSLATQLILAIEGVVAATMWEVLEYRVFTSPSVVLFVVDAALNSRGGRTRDTQVRGCVLVTSTQRPLVSISYPAIAQELLPPCSILSKPDPWWVSHGCLTSCSLGVRRWALSGKRSLWAPACGYALLAWKSAATRPTGCRMKVGFCGRRLLPWRFSLAQTTRGFDMCSHTRDTRPN